MRLADRAFVRLVRHFATVIIYSGQDSGAADLNLGIGGVLGLLALPGAFFSLTLLDKYSSFLRWMRGIREFDIFTVSIPDKYFFIVFSMVVTGTVAVLKWDRILPGRQDYVNLAPLPLAAAKIFAANLTAILLLAAIFALDVNAIATVLFPFVVLAAEGSFSAYFSFVAAHAVTVILASFFTFFSCFAVVGSLMAFLPARWFRRVSMPVRLAIVTLLIATLFTNAKAPGYVPAVWFVDLYQMVQGKASPEMVHLARLALQSSAGVFVAALIFGAIGYRRHFIRIPEMADAPPARRGWRINLMSNLLDGWLLTKPFQRACYHFGLRVLLRNETHAILLGAFIGFGLVSAAQRIATGGLVNQFAVPMCVAYLLITGLRFTFQVPAGLTANWVYRLAIDAGARDASTVAWKLILTFLVAGVILPCLLVSSALWGPRVGLIHSALVLGSSVLLIDLCLLKFHKVPFACSQPGFENHAIVVVLVYTLGYFVFTGMIPKLEQWMLGSPVRLLTAPVLFGVGWFGIQEMRREIEDINIKLTFESPESRVVQTLNLLG